MKTIQDLHETALRVSRDYLAKERELITILGELDARLGFRDLGFPSLHAYATKALRLSDDVAFILIRLARASRAVPELKTKLETHAITLSNARLIAPVLKPENAGTWLAKAETLSKRELEKELVREFPAKVVKEKAKFVGENRIRLEVGLSEEIHGNLERVKDLLSQKLGRAVSTEEAPGILSQEFLTRTDPLLKAERAGRRKAATRKPAGEKACETTATPDFPRPALAPGRAASPPRRRIPARIRHAVQRRDDGRCTGRDLFGVRCKNRRFLHYHHIRPKSAGGDESEGNLELRCSACHALEHWRGGSNPVPLAAR